MGSLIERMRGLASLFWREVAKFGTVGGVAFVIDNSLTWILMHSIMDGSQTKARFVGASVATIFSWLANRLWTFRHRRQSNVGRELGMFLLINGIGIGISTGFTAIAEYWLGITENTPLFFAGVIGILVATVVRFFAYRFWVFNEELDAEPAWRQDHVIFDHGHAHHEAGNNAGAEQKRATGQPTSGPDGH
ncbi:putative flippase GtrA [Arthrobacter roseus]|nr:putative flippase GtrA [Arthrobacter roseus]